MLLRPRIVEVLFAVAMLAAGVSTLDAQSPASITGIVRDSAGVPLRDVEIILRDAGRATRSDERGQFLLGDVAPGAYVVWFRRLGYRSVEFNWPARVGERTSVEVALQEITRQLDPVVVRAEEDKTAAARASILGLVIDTDGNAIPEAEVQLVGGNGSGTTRANGGFLFRPLATGTYVIRVRKLGYEPGTVTLQLVQGDDREVVIRMHPLATGLDPTVVTERSGYGRDQVAWDELEHRKRWVSFKSRLLGPEDLRAFYGTSLDYALVRVGLNSPGPSARDVRPKHIKEEGTRPANTNTVVPGDACILINGKDPVRLPLSLYSADDIELLEIYPPGTELTGTVSWHFHGPPCEATSMLIHPTYYVLWFKRK